MTALQEMVRRIVEETGDPLAKVQLQYLQRKLYITVSWQQHGETRNVALDDWRVDDLAFFICARVAHYRATIDAEHAKIDIPWHQHDGFMSPVAAEVRVEVKLRSGETLVRTAGVLPWQNTNSPDDIIEYRVLSEPPKQYTLGVDIRERAIPTYPTRDGVTTA